MKQKLIDLATEWKNDFGYQLIGRLTGVFDLVAEEACYHIQCYSKLYNKQPANEVGIIEITEK